MPITKIIITKNSKELKNIKIQQSHIKQSKDEYNLSLQNSLYNKSKNDIPKEYNQFAKMLKKAIACAVSDTRKKKYLGDI